MSTIQQDQQDHERNDVLGKSLMDGSSSSTSSSDDSSSSSQHPHDPPRDHVVMLVMRSPLHQTPQENGRTTSSESISISTTLHNTTTTTSNTITATNARKKSNGNGNGNGIIQRDIPVPVPVPVPCWDEKDQEGISLLRVIFPDATRDELEEIHYRNTHTCCCSDIDTCSGNGTCTCTCTCINDSNTNTNGDGDGDINRTCRGGGTVVAGSANDKQGDASTTNKSRIRTRRNNDAPVHQPQAQPQPPSQPRPPQSQSQSQSQQRPELELPKDFLRIPQHQALKLPNKDKHGQMEWNIVKNLERHVVEAHVWNDVDLEYPLSLAVSVFSSSYGNDNDNDNDNDNGNGNGNGNGNDNGPIVRTAVFARDPQNGLGMQLREWQGYIFVQSLTCPNANVNVNANANGPNGNNVNANANGNRNRIANEESYQMALKSGIEWKEFGAAFEAGVMPGDQILGVNGLPLLRWGARRSEGTGAGSGNVSSSGGHRVTMSSKDVLIAAARMIRASGDPIVLHLLRGNGKSNGNINGNGNGQHPIHARVRVSQQPPPQMQERNDPDDHSSTAKSDVSELTSWHLVNANADSGEYAYHSNYYDVHPLIQEFVKRGLAKTKKEQRNISRDLERLTTRAAMWKKNDYLRSAPFRNSYECTGTFNHGHDHDHDQSEEFGIDFVRQALGVHIVNTFVDKDRLAYTIYIVDVESKKEWYAPIRYFVDFEELRSATVRLNRAVEKLPFPTSSWLFGIGQDEASLSFHIKDARIKQLEEFIRGLCNLVYTENVDNATCEIALFVQAFLGCDSLERDENIFDSQVSVPLTMVHLHVAGVNKAVDILKESIQLYTYRLFLMPTFKTLIVRFIGDIKRRASLIEEKKTVSLSSSIVEKEKIIVELVTVKHVFANILDLIQKGCIGDFKAMGAYHLQPTMNIEDLDNFIEPIVREAVQEQIEIEAYVPCRSIISSLLVHGWRYEDKAISFKIGYLKQQSQSYFKIKKETQSPSGWHSVITILDEGVGRSTLPCNKLNAIVGAGKEIGRLSILEHPSTSGHSSLGADDFLPIFIYCVVNAGIDRPCALCALLKHLCNDLQQIGEVGYYLSSFEATIMYIHEMDLALAE